MLLKKLEREKRLVVMIDAALSSLPSDGTQDKELPEAPLEGFRLMMCDACFRHFCLEDCAMRAVVPRLFCANEGTQPEMHPPLWIEARKVRSELDEKTVCGFVCAFPISHGQDPSASRAPVQS